jgi:chitodextrinase
MVEYFRRIELLMKISSIKFLLTVCILTFFTANLFILTPAAFSITRPDLPGMPEQLVTVPAGPSNLELTDKTSSSVTLNWQDNSSNEDGFRIVIKNMSSLVVTLPTVAANITSFTLTGLSPSTTYIFELKSYNSAGESGQYVLVDYTTDAAESEPVPPAPSGVTAAAVSGSEISLAWTDNANNETGYKIERKTKEGTYTEIGTVNADIHVYTDSGLTPGLKYYYRVKAFNASGDSAYSNETSVTTTAAASQTFEIKLYIGSSGYYVNNVIQQMDVAPIILEGRTLLPARYIAEALGAEVQWIAPEKKVVITRGTKVIEMWLNKPAARVNGVEQYIDPNNSKVSPLSIPPGRTMTPGRFIAENLGAAVAWDPIAREVKIIYSP